MTSSTTNTAALPLVQTTAPERIYLAVSDEEYDRDRRFLEHDEIGWSTDEPLAVCVPYVRADLATLTQQQGGLSLDRIEAPTGQPPRAWTAQEKIDCAAAMKSIVAREQQGSEQEAGDVEKQARTLLAIEYERDGLGKIGEYIRNPDPSIKFPIESCAIRAITAALRTKQPAASEGDGLSRVHAMFRALGFDGLEALPGWGWSYSRSGCAVEAMIENGILLEHFDDWVGFRPSANTSKQADGEAVDKGPWRWLWKGDIRGDGAYELQSEDFAHDARIKVSGDFADHADVERYMLWLSDTLNATTPPRHPADEGRPR